MLINIKWWMKVYNILELRGKLNCILENFVEFFLGIVLKIMIYSKGFIRWGDILYEY